MADLSFIEKTKFETFFGMNSGYVLSFSDRTFQEFVADVTNLDIHDQKYTTIGTSKANKLRTFIKVESNYTVGCLLEKLVEFAMLKYQDVDFVNTEEFGVYEGCLKVIKKLKEGNIVEHLDALQPNNNDKDFKILTKSIKESIEKNEPEVALDRLHTFVVKYIRELCTKNNISYEKSESINAIFGKYIKFLVDNNLIESTMSEKILKYSINIIDAFNDVRNNKSLAHDNPILNYDESILIFNNVTNSIKFIQAIEQRNSQTEVEETLPF